MDRSWVNSWYLVVSNIDESAGEEAIGRLKQLSVGDPGPRFGLLLPKKINGS